MPRRGKFQFSVVKGNKRKVYWKRPKRGRKRFAKRFTNRITRVKISPTIIPDKAILKLTKSSSFSITANVDDSGSNIFGTMTVIGNGFTNLAGGPMLDVDVPAGLQNWSNFYNRYRILSSRVVVAFQPSVQADLAATPKVSVMPGVQFSANYNDIADQAYVKWRLNSAVGAPIQVIKHYMKSKKMFGTPVTQEEDFQGELLAGPPFDTFNPDHQWYWYVSVGATGTASKTFTGYFTITYYVQLEDRLTQVSVVPSESKGESAVTVLRRARK